MSKIIQSAKAVQPPRAMLEPPAIARKPLNPKLGYELTLDPTHPYFKQRGLDPEIIARFGLGYSASGPLAGRIAIPIHNVRGDLVGYAGRWPGNPLERRSKYKFLNKHWTSSEVFNLHRALETPDDWPLIIVQGFFDVIKLWQMGCERAVAIMGAELQSSQLERILSHRPVSPLILLFDGTEEGRWGRDKAVIAAARHTQVRYHELRDGLRPEDLTRDDVEFLCDIGKRQS